MHEGYILLSLRNFRYVYIYIHIQEIYQIIKKKNQLIYIQVYTQKQKYRTLDNFIKKIFLLIKDYENSIKNFIMI